MNRREYRRLLQDPKWKIKASFIRKRDNHMCCHCGKKSHRLQVHHKKYIDGLMPWEYENELLESLCSTCHKKEHNIKPKVPKRFKKTAKKKEPKVIKRTIKIKPDEEF
jgi:5-methylcytosine-specific restriction endonuclease McrA